MRSSQAGERRRAGGRPAARTDRPVRALSPKQVERLRKRAQARRALQIRVGLVVVAIALVWGGWAALSSSSLFRIEQVEVVGAERVPESEVTSRAAVPDDATLLNLDVAEIEGRLLKDPWIASAHISRRIPSTLRIRIEERVPVAVVDTGMTFWFVDGNARVLAESVPDTSAVLPVIRDVPDFTAEPGVRSRSASLDNALAVLRGLDTDLVATVRTVSAPSVNETSLLTSGNVEIMIGEATQLSEKSTLVRDILAERAGVVFIDVRSVERPISRGLEP